MKRWAALLCLLALVTAGCSTSMQRDPGGQTPTGANEQVEGLEPGKFGLSSLPTGIQALNFVYQVNGEPEHTLKVDLPSGAAPAIAAPEYNKALPAAWFQYAWNATLADGTTQVLAQGQRIFNSQFTTDAWGITRSANVVLFTAKGASAPDVQQVEQEYQREVHLFDGDRVKPMSPVRIYVFRNQKDFGHFTSAAGEALGVVDYGIQAAYVLSEGDERRVLRTTVHEMAHLLAGVNYGYPFIVEGLARYAEEPYIPSSELDGYLRLVAKRVESMGGPPRIDILDSFQLYGAGFLFVKYLDSRYGHDKFLDFLAKAREPQAVFSDVLQHVYGRNIHELDGDVGLAVAAWVKGDRSLFQMPAGQ